MIKNYLKIAFRNLKKEKSFTAINIFGLGIAFAAGILLFLTANFHFSYDDFHKNKYNIYKVYTKVNRPQKTEYGSAMAEPMQPTLEAEYKSEIIASTRISDGGGLLKLGDKIISSDFNYVDPGYMSMFSFDLKEGIKKGALDNLSSIVLSSKTAQSLFGEKPAVGNTIIAQIGNDEVPLMVTGVLTQTPENSTLEAENLIRFENNPNYHELKGKWDWRNHDVYIQLADGIEWIGFEKKLKGFTGKYFKGDIEFGIKNGMVKDDRGEVISTRLLPFTDEHFNSVVGSQSIDKYYPYILLAIGFLIILIASINFINLSIVRSLSRASEVGMRKALGAMRGQVIGQFWGEAMLVSVLGLLVGLGLGYFAIPQFNAMVNGNIAFSMILKWKVLFTILGVFLLVSLLAGGYPAWLVSKFNTVEVLKGKVKKGMSSGSLRNSLIIVQFAISVMLISCTLVIWKQIDYLQNKPLGYNQNQLISIPIGSGVNGYKMVEYFRNQLANQPQILNITGSDNNLGMGKDNSKHKSVFAFGMDDKEFTTNGLSVDFDYPETIGLTFIAGRSFDRKFSTDSTEACIINETMAKQLGGTNLINKRLPLDKGKVIIGIVNDYHFESLHNKVESNTLFFNKDFGLSYIFVKVSSSNPKQTMDLLEKTYLSYTPKNAFLASYVDENTQSQYQKEKRISQIFISAAILAIVLSCIGLFAIALMVIRNRTKEIGVRKVLGASTGSLVSLLSRDFLKLVFLSFIIAFPAAYYGMSSWLADFPYRVSIEWWIMAVAGLAAILIAFFTVGIHAYRAALMNPVESLKTE